MVLRSNVIDVATCHVGSEHCWMTIPRPELDRCPAPPQASDVNRDGSLGREPTQPSACRYFNPAPIIHEQALVRSESR